ncbi:hypothetical protein BGZ79_004092 [Entomortierella chlamydospora]|nr:hypothetical protein BGZ79_004092 [Entomortierella chlamydospora]
MSEWPSSRDTSPEWSQVEAGDRSEGGSNRDEYQSVGESSQDEYQPGGESSDDEHKSGGESRDDDHKSGGESCDDEHKSGGESSDNISEPYKRQSAELSDTESEADSNKSTKTDLIYSDQEDEKLSASDSDEGSIVSKTESIVEAGSAASKFGDDVAEPMTENYHLPERMCMPKTAYVNACRICLDFPKATSSDRCYPIENSEPTTLTKEVPPDQWCTPKNAKELNSGIRTKRLRTKDRASTETMRTSNRDKSMPPKDKTFVKAVPGATTKEGEAILQEFWGSFVPRSYMDSSSSDDYDIAAGFIIGGLFV